MPALPEFTASVAHARSMSLNAASPTHGTTCVKSVVQMERAAASLWTRGIVHCDLHKGNAMWDSASGKLTLLDFGFAVVLPRRVLQGLNRRLVRALRGGAGTLAVAFQGSSAQQHLNRVQAGRKYEWYNADAKAIAALYRRLSPADRAAVPKARRALWGLR